MKKTLPFILIIFALAHVAGIMPLYFYLLDEIKGKMTIELSSESNLQKILVTSTEYNDPSVFQKTEDSEFNFRGQMYDFRVMKKCGDAYIFYGLTDNNETHLIGLLKSIFGQDNNYKNSSSPFSVLLKNLSPDFIFPVTKDFTAYVPETIYYNSFHLIAGLLPGYLMPVSVPPDFS